MLALLPGLLASHVDPEAAAATTTNRKRMVVHNAFGYAQEIGLVDDNPMSWVSWKSTRVITQIDPRTVVSHDQASRFLYAVKAHNKRGSSLAAFFGCMYYAGLRPEEATELSMINLVHLPTVAGQWGELELTQAIPRSGSRWTNSGRPRE